MTYPPSGGTPNPHNEPSYGQQPPYGQQPSDPTAPYGQPYSDPYAVPGSSSAPPSWSNQPASAQPYGAQPTSAQPASAQPASGQPYGDQPQGGQPYGGQPYGGQYPPAYPAPGYAPARGTNVLAILSLVFAFVFAPVGVVLGHVAKKQIKETGEDGDGLATAGLITSYVISGLYLAACCAWGIGLAIAANAAANTGY